MSTSDNIAAIEKADEFVERIAIQVHCKDSDEHTLKWAKQPGKYRAGIRRDVRDVIAALAECGFEVYQRSTLLAEARKAEAVTRAMKTPFCVLFLDGRNEHGSHVLPSYPRSFEVVADDIAEQAEAILEAAENAGFQTGQHVWAEFAWIAPQIGDEGRVELDGYWDFRWINEPMSILLNGGSDEGN